MACYSCGYKGKLKNSKIKMHQYLESGLDNVFLVNVPSVKCPECDVDLPVIENPDKLHELIAQAIFEKKFLLTAKEIRFLRTQLGYSQKDFAHEISVAKEYMNRVENGHDRVTPELDKTVRLNFLRLKGTPKRNYEDLKTALQHSLEKKEVGVQQLRLKAQGQNWNITSKAA